MGVRAGGGKERGKGEGEGGESLILRNHTDPIVNPSAATSYGCGLGHVL